MDAIDSGRLPGDSVRARARVEAWRQRRPVGARIPKALWALAVRLVKRHGVNRPATALGVDSYSLKRRAPETAAARPSRGPATRARI